MNSSNDVLATAICLDESSPVIADTRRGRVEYAEFGEGPAVIALHGAMGGYDQSLILARTAGVEGFRYIAVSRPGYLGTPITSGRTPEDQSDLCAGLLDALGIHTAVVMAVSGGGPCALNFAIRHGDRCRGLVLVSTCGAKLRTPIPFSFKLMGLLLRLPGFAASIEKKASAGLDQAAIRSIADPALRERTLRDPEAGPLFTALLRSTSHRMTERMPGTSNDIRVTRTTDYPLEKINAPTLIVHGTADGMVPFEAHGKLLASGIRDAELITIEGGEHVSIFTHLDVIRPRIASFLKEHAG
jgi:pimeloyl-ACP methyl ester carboxylesterase